MATSWLVLGVGFLIVGLQGCSGACPTGAAGDTFCQGMTGQFYADPCDCTKFVQCANGLTYLQSCAGGLVWSQSQLTCIQGSCSSPRTAVPSPPAATTSPPTSPITSTGAMCSGGTLSGTFCQGKTAGGYYADPCNCANFVICGAGGTATVESCGAGTIWSQSVTTCISGSCGTPSTASAPPPATSTSGPSSPLPPPPTATVSSAPPPGLNPGALSIGSSGTAICTEFGTYGPAEMATVACQNELNKPSDASTKVTAWSMTNTPSYNSQCGQCLYVQNLNGAGAAYVTVIDLKGASGLDLNYDVAMSFAGIYQNGHVSCSWTVVNPSMCSFH